MSGLAALLVVATFALSSCGSDDGAATATTQASGSGSTVVQTVTQTATATAGSTTARPATTAPAATTSTAPTPAKPQPATTTSSATQRKPSSVCPPVDVGVRDGDFDSTFADIRGKRNINCVAAAEIVRQWGGQRIGGSKALLPDGWTCTKSNVCSDRRSSIRFTLDYPSESE